MKNTAGRTGRHNIPTIPSDYILCAKNIKKLKENLAMVQGTNLNCNIQLD